MILHTLQLFSSTIKKQQILKEQADQADLMMFDYGYNKEKMYHLKFSDEEINMKTVKPFTLGLKELLDRLIARELTGGVARQTVNKYAARNGDLIKLICNKDLQCGASVTTINKVFPGTIPVFKLQLAKEVPLTSLVYPQWAQMKYDGVRIAITFDGKEMLFRTRNGKVIPLPQVEQFLRTFITKPIMLDTEVTLLSGKCEERTQVSGMLNSARQGGKINEDALHFHVFDAMEYSEFT